MSVRTDLEELRLAFVANGVVFSALLMVITIAVLDRGAYHRVVQEDGPLEWATVMVLIPAALLAGRATLRGIRSDGPFPWFLAGLTAFCVFFAGEEISWGQRLMAYQPPEYFLEHNTQQEFNVHNLFKDLIRTRYLLLMILVVYGVALPLVDRYTSRARELLERLGVVVLPVSLVPAFGAVALFLALYPFKYSGEVAECLFALTLFLAIAIRVEPRADFRPAPALPLDAALALTTGLCVAVGVAAPPLLGLLIHGSDEDRVARAAAEAEALGEDWTTQADRDGESPSRCGSHIRVWTWVEKHAHGAFVGGAFHALDGDETRRRYFLDPWNNPYWLRHVCDGAVDGIVLYSFGPDRRRGSTDAGLAGDDVGVDIGPRVEGVQ